MDNERSAGMEYHNLPDLIMPRPPEIPNPFEPGQILTARQLELLRQVALYAFESDVKAGPGLVSRRVGKSLILSANNRVIATEIQRHPFEVEKVTGLQVLVNQGIVYHKNRAWTDGGSKYVGDTIIYGDLEPEYYQNMGNTRVSGSVTLANNDRSMVLLKCVYTYEAVSDNAEENHADYLTFWMRPSYSITHDTISGSVASGTAEMDTLSSSYYIGTNSTVYFPIAEVLTSGGAVTEITQIMDNNWHDPFTDFATETPPPP